MLFCGCFEADRLEGMVDSLAASECSHCFDRITLAGGHHVGGAETLGEFQLRLLEIDSDDPACAGQRCALDHGEADPTTTDHDARLTGTDASLVERSTDTGHDRASWAPYMAVGSMICRRRTLGSSSASSRRTLHVKRGAVGPSTCEDTTLTRARG